MENTQGFSCALTTPELQERKATIIKDLKSLLVEKEELSDGYIYKFESSDENIYILTEFVKTERQCCSFFNFNLEIQNNHLAQLKITGKPGAKEFLEPELQL